MGWTLRRASPPPPLALPPPPELSNGVAASLVLVSVACVLLCSSIFGRGELWNPIPPHYVFLLSRAWQSYNSSLERHPRITHIITGACISVLGNRIGRGAFGVFSIHYGLWGAFASLVSGEWIRMLNAAYAGRRSRLDLFKKAVVDQLVTVPFFSFAYQCFFGVLQGVSWPNIWQGLGETYWQCCLTGWQFWPPVVVLAYAYVPSQLQVVFFSAAGLAWNVLLTCMHAQH